MDGDFGGARLDDINPEMHKDQHEKLSDEDEMMKINPQSDPRIQMAEDLNMRSLSTRMIAKSLIPKVSVLRKALKNGDVYIKFERILDEFNSLLYYNSIIEVLFWILGLV